MNTSFQLLMEEYRRQFDDQLSLWLESRRSDTASYAPQAVALLDNVSALVSAGGKRLRPALVSFGYQACGGQEPEMALPVAMATELVHSYLLIHDDIMDHAATRRGLPASHIFFRNEHRQRSWKGNSEEHGVSMAILAGDLAHVCAQELFASTRVEGERRRQLAEVFFRMSREVIDGQYLEMQMGLDGDPSQEDLGRVLLLKSGLYSVQRPLQLGAVLAAADDQQMKTLSAYGEAIGEAFQLQDDLLGMFGDPSATGKPVGEDLREGKFTFLIDAALTALSPVQEERLRAALGNPDASPEEVAAVCDLIRQSGAAKQVEDRIAKRSDEAREILSHLSFADDIPSDQGSTFLHGLIDFLSQRKH